MQRFVNHTPVILGLDPRISGPEHLARYEVRHGKGHVRLNHDEQTSRNALYRRDKRPSFARLAASNACAPRLYRQIQPDAACLVRTSFGADRGDTSRKGTEAIETRLENRLDRRVQPRLARSVGKHRRVIRAVSSSGLTRGSHRREVVRSSRTMTAHYSKGAA